MKKLIFSLLFLFALLGFSFADKTIILTPGWNVVSTPKLLSGINFSNSGAGISFYILSGSSWLSIIPTINTVKPLEGFVVNNSNTGDVTLTLNYRTDVSPMETLFQKTLNLGRNFLGITTTTNPFASISNATMYIDFTKYGSSNLSNKVNAGSSSSIDTPELGEAYGVFISYLPSIYGGNQNEEDPIDPDVCTTPENVLSCSLGLETCPEECREPLIITNTSASTKNVQSGDSNIELARLEFSTASDVTSRIYSFKASTAGTGWQAFDGAGITVYNQNGTALVSAVINSGNSWKETFVLPIYLSLSKNNPVTLILKLDQVPNTITTTGKYLQLMFATGDFDVKDIVNQDPLYPAIGVVGTLLSSVIGGQADVVSQSYTNSLVKYGTLAVIGNVKVKAVNTDVVFKDAYFELSGLVAASGHMNKISSAKLFENGVEIATLTKNGNTLYATNMNKTITVGTTNTYEVGANISTINTNADVLPSFVTKLATGTFETVYGNALTPLTAKVISATTTVVNEIPTITAVTATTKGNNVVYKITLNSVKETSLKGIVASVYGENLSGGSAVLSGLTATLSSDDLGTTDYATGLVAGNTVTLGGLSANTVSVLGTRDVYLIVENAILDGNGNGTPGVRVTLTDMSYFDVFEDATTSAVNGALNGYQALIAGALNLTAKATR